MKKLLVVILTVVMLLAFGIVASAEENEPVAKVGNTEYTTIEEAIANWTNNTTLTLLSDVTLTDTITLKSTEHHILNLGTYTLTAASGKDVFVIKACGTGSAEKSTITINADSTNPGGINAGSKRIVYYKYADGGITAEDRPIIKITGGVFTSTGTGIYTIGTAARKCATLNISGGTFDCTINGSSKSKLIISGGTFNKSVSSQGDSTCSRLISGGKFKTIGFMTADTNNTKFWIGTSMANSNVGVYVDANGYLVVGGAVITEAGDRFEAHSTNYSGWSSYLKYSSAATYGLYYETASEALADNAKGNVTIFGNELVLDSSTTTGYKGIITAPSGTKEFTISYPQGTTPSWTVDASNLDGKIVVKKEFTTSTFSANSAESVIINYVAYNTLAEAIAEAQSGDTITLVRNVDVEETITIPEDLSITIDLNGNNLTAANDSVNLVIEGTLTINDTAGTGISTMRNHMVKGELIVNGGTLQNIATLSAGFTVYVDGGKVTINGGTIQAVNDSNYAIAAVAEAGEIAINAGAVKGNRGCLSVETGSKVTISGGEFNVTGAIGGHCVYVTNGDVTISNGTFVPYVDNNQITSYSAYLNGKDANVTITGGTFGDDVYNRAAVTASAGTLVVSGGTFEAEVARKYCAYGFECVESNGTYSVAVWNVELGEILTYLGVSTRENGTGITVGYEFDNEAYALYCAQNDVTLEIGTHFAVKGYSALEQSLTDYTSDAGQFNVVVKNLNATHESLALEMTLYIVNGDSKQYASPNGFVSEITEVYAVANYYGKALEEVNA